MPQPHFKLILTMHALDEKIPDEMWEIFLNNQPIELEKVNTFRYDSNKYFLLDRAIDKKNLAEAVLISFILLQSEKGLHKELFSFYKGLKGLYVSGLEKYARDYAIEENFYFLAK